MGELLGSTIRTRFEVDSRWCQSLRVCRIDREGICFAIVVSQECETGKVTPGIQQCPLISPCGNIQPRTGQVGFSQILVVEHTQDSEALGIQQVFQFLRKK